MLAFIYFFFKQTGKHNVMCISWRAETCKKVCVLSTSMMNDCRHDCTGISTDLIIVLAVNIASFRSLARLVCLLVRNGQIPKTVRQFTHTKCVKMLKPHFGRSLLRICYLKGGNVTYTYCLRVIAAHPLVTVNNRASMRLITLNVSCGLK